MHVCFVFFRVTSFAQGHLIPEAAKATAAPQSSTWPRATCATCATCATRPTAPVQLGETNVRWYNRCEANFTEFYTDQYSNPSNPLLFSSISWCNMSYSAWTFVIFSALFVDKIMFGLPTSYKNQSILLAQDKQMAHLNRCWAQSTHVFMPHVRLKKG